MDAAAHKVAPNAYRRRVLDAWDAWAMFPRDRALVRGGPHAERQRRRDALLDAGMNAALARVMEGA